MMILGQLAFEYVAGCAFVSDAQIFLRGRRGLLTAPHPASSRSRARFG